jgi:hypothetical protein
VELDRQDACPTQMGSVPHNSRACIHVKKMSARLAKGGRELLLGNSGGIGRCRRSVYHAFASFLRSNREQTPRLTQTVGNASLAQIVGRHLDAHAITNRKANKMFAHLS